jgi:hypothetical protein
MNATHEVSYCGLYCPNCGVRCHLPQYASTLIEEMKVGEFDEWGHSLEGFTAFWKFLNGLADASVQKRCREETCGVPDCSIRNCAKGRGVDACPLCDDYPCQMIHRFSKSRPTLLFDGERMKEIGMEPWISEQEMRRQNGFCYGDIRCGKVGIPQD